MAFYNAFRFVELRLTLNFLLLHFFIHQFSVQVIYVLCHQTRIEGFIFMAKVKVFLYGKVTFVRFTGFKKFYQIVVPLPKRPWMLLEELLS